MHESHYREPAMAIHIALLPWILMGCLDCGKDLGQIIKQPLCKRCQRNLSDDQWHRLDTEAWDGLCKEVVWKLREAGV